MTTEENINENYIENIKSKVGNSFANCKILLIGDKSTIRYQKGLEQALNRLHTNVVSIYDPVAALVVYQKFKPDFVIAFSDSRILNGFSVLAILNGMIRPDNLFCNFVVLINGTNKPVVMKFSCQTFPVDDVSGLNTFITEKLQISNDGTLHAALFNPLDAVARTLNNQFKLLPEPSTLEFEGFKLDYVFSPYGDYSGDGLEYWVDKSNGHTIYGFIIDCTGHDINSFSQVREFRALFHIYMTMFYSKPSLAFKTINQEMFKLHKNDLSCVASIGFIIDTKTKKLTYCSAGVPIFWKKKFGSNVYESVKMKNVLLGFVPDAQFKEETISFDGEIEEIVFASDGFSELMYKPVSDLKQAKHDDTSAIYIKQIAKKK